MTAYETRCEREDEEDRLDLLRPWRMKIRSLQAHNAEAQKVGAVRRGWTPFDKQGDVEPFDVEADWAERA